jgi:G-protein coupled receptor 98
MVVATGLSTDLTIQRISGVKLSSQVRYSTSEPLDSIIIGKLTFAPAMASVHFTSVDAVNVIFNVDVGDVTIPITIISTDTVPRAFYVNIEATNNEYELFGS